MRRLTNLRLLGIAVVVAVGVVALGSGVSRWRAHRWIQNGARLLSQNDYSSAVRALLPAVVAAPGDADAHYYLGLAYSGMGLDEGALNQLEEAVRLAPGEARVHASLGQAYRKAGATTNALAQYEQAVRLDPGEPRYQVALGGLLLDEDHLPEAVERLRRAEQGRPHSPEIHLLLADTLRRLGDREGMSGEYREVIRLAGESALGELARQEARSADAGPGGCR